VLRGHEAVKSWWAQILETFDWHWEPEELIEAGDAVVVVSRQIARGRWSGAEVTNRVAGVFTFRDGKVISIDAYQSKGQALAAARLSDG
jgi:ketosteroid isomerase-like protein